MAIVAFCANDVQGEARRGAETGAATAAACPYAIDNGCAGANQNSNLKDPTLLASSIQSGQSWTSKHPMNFNVPGVDYPVGYDKTVKLKDPQTDATLLANCPYRAGVFLCNSGSTPPINGFDFTGAISAYGHPFSLQFGPNTIGTCQVTNSKFLVDSTNTASPVWFKNGTCNRIFKYNQCSGSGASGSATSCIQDDSRSPSNNSDYEYNAFPNQGFPRIITSVGSAGAGLTRTFKYNYVYGLGQKDDPNHGEIDLYGGQCRGCGYTVKSVEWTGNFIVWAKATLSVNNATFFAGTGDQNNYRTLATTINSNIIVANRDPSGAATIGRVVVDGEWASLGAVTYNNNYVDPTGAFFCAVNGLVVQNTVATVNGNTATVTSGTLRGVEIGYNINGPGMLQATITNVSGGGGAGTVYTFDGSPQNRGSIAVTLTPGILSLASSGNRNLTDGSSTDVRGPQLSGSCNNSHR